MGMPTLVRPRINHLLALAAVIMGRHPTVGSSPCRNTAFSRECQMCHISRPLCNRPPLTMVLFKGRNPNTGQCGSLSHNKCRAMHGKGSP